MARKKLKVTQHSATIADVEGAIANLRDELGEEMRSWYDNMSENLQGGDKGSSVDEAASTLEGLDCPDIPDLIDGLGFDYTTQHKGGRKGDPRWLRRDNEVSILQSAAETTRGWVDDVEECLKDLPDDAEDDTEVEFRDQTHTVGELRQGIEDATQFADDLDNVISDAEGVEFPGMYG